MATLVWALALAACGGDSRPRDGGFVFSDGGPPDLGRDAARDAAAETGPLDAGDAQADAAADASDASVEAGRDAALPCRTARDCPEGLSCLGGVCGPATDCCATIACREGSVCDPESCSCVPIGGGCCFDGFCGDPSSYCDFDTCECRRVECDPACPDGSTCDFGECYPDCWIRGSPCPTGQVCSFEDGCVDARCTDEECLSMSPPSRCDPTVGCQPSCMGDWSWCRGMGGRCFLDQCVDDSCGEREGFPPRFCTYVTDCCGNAVCQHTDDPEPFCPRPCPDPAPSPPVRADLCACSFGFGAPPYCVDLNYGGAFPVPVPVPGGPTPPPPID